MAQKVFLIPSLLTEDAGKETIPYLVVEIVRGLRIFLAEEPSAARRFLKKICPDFPLSQSEIFSYNEHSNETQLREYFSLAGDRDFGVISEAGCPCVADPGADVVFEAHRRGIEVVPLPGPSSILLALMASGLNGQNFAFNGYLPKDQAARTRRIRELEHRSKTEGQTQIFMETPYRSQALFEELLRTCRPQTFLCVAADLNGRKETVQTFPVKEWQQKRTDLKKRPVMFLISA